MQTDPHASAPAERIATLAVPPASFPMNASSFHSHPNSSQLRRTLKARHMSSDRWPWLHRHRPVRRPGATIFASRSGCALLAYMVVGLMVYFLMTSLGEMASHLPVSGSFATYGAKYVDPGFGFALGWNYWYNWAGLTADLVAAQLVMAYWFPGRERRALERAVSGADGWAERAVRTRLWRVEFWFATIKAVTVLVFIAVGLLMVLGILKRAARPSGFWGQRPPTSSMAMRPSRAALPR